MMSPDSHVPLTEPQLYLCTCIGTVYYGENAHRSGYTCSSVICLSDGFGHSSYALSIQTCNKPET